MSVPVSIERLRQAMDDFHRAPYLLTVRGDGRPHAVAVAVRWADSDLELTVGRTSATNAGERPLVSLVWPPDEVGGYSLIVDALTLDGTPDSFPVLRLRPTKAVLHRAPVSDATSATPDACPSDCIPLTSG